MTYVITNKCIDKFDQSCIQECPVDCIKTDGIRAYIDPNDCVDCGACEPVCPVDAIYYETNLPEQFSNELMVNEIFFKDKK